MGDEFEVFHAFHEADAAQHELRAVFLNRLAADVEVGVLHRRHHFHEVTFAARIFVAESSI
jgi:hypothetical protein